MEELIKKSVNPENGIEVAICENDEFIKGSSYGKVRSGHPEGAVIYHIKEVLDNIDKYSDVDNRSDLRLIAIVHDTFKYKVDNTKPKFGENHHGMIARRFAENYTKDQGLLKIIELHDEGYNAWQKGDRKGDWYGAKKRANDLIKTLYKLDVLDLYLTFYKCDNQTGDKSQDNYVWFKELVEEFL